MNYAGKILIACLLLVSANAHAQYKTHGAGYCPPKAGTYDVPHVSYADKKYPVYSPWSWSPWATDGTYFIRQRWVYTAADVKTLEDDGWLYVKIDGSADGYTRALLKVQYGVASLGNARYGYDVFKYNAAQVLSPKIAVYLPPTHVPAVELPTPANVASILGDPNYNNDVNSEDGYKAELLRIQGNQRFAEAKLKLKADELKMRNELANRAQDNNEVLQYAAMIREFAEARAKRLAVGNLAHADASSITLGNRDVANILATKCLSCHGPDKQEKGFDVRNADAFSLRMWSKVSRLVHSGAMPPGQDKLTSEELEAIDSMLPAEK